MMNIKLISTIMLITWTQTGCNHGRSIELSIGDNGSVVGIPAEVDPTSGIVVIDTDNVTIEFPNKNKPLRLKVTEVHFIPIDNRVAGIVLKVSNGDAISTKNRIREILGYMTDNDLQERIDTAIDGEKKLGGHLFNLNTHSLGGVEDVSIRINRPQAKPVFDVQVELFLISNSDGK